MNRILIINIMVVLLLVTVTATAQRKDKRSQDNTTAFHEFARLGKWNSQWPVQINLHITHQVTPAVYASDSADTDMTLYYDPHSFYMKAEGMEQIANDSVLIMVNNTAGMIRIFPNSGMPAGSQGNNITSFVQDTSIEKLSQRFTATIQEDGRTGKRILLQSHDKIATAGLEKELIDVSYNAGNYQPLNFKQIRRSVVPVDSTTYSELNKNSAWQARLITTNVKARQLYFVVKEEVTQCRFISIDHSQKTSPVHEHHRVIKTASGEYLPAKGFEPYNVSQE